MTQGNAIIRPAVAADLPAIQGFDQFRHVTAEVIAGGQCDVVDVGGAVAAYMVRTNLLFGRPFVSFVVVHGDHRRCGHAGRLLAHAEADCPQEKLWISTALDNIAMQKLLAARGYRMAGVLDEMFNVPELIYFKKVR